MIQGDNDILDGMLVAMDLEWVGSSFRPHTTHVVQLACKNIHTGHAFSRTMTALSGNNPDADAQYPADVYREWLGWLDAQGSGTVYLVAHNGIRFDAPVLRNGMTSYGVPIPSRLQMMDSLHHIRYHSRHWQFKPPRYDLDSMCAYFDIPVAAGRRHTAEYDVELLCEVLCTMSFKHSVPIISGVAHPVSELSTMLVRGIGPVVYTALPCTDLVVMCSSIIKQGGDLGEDSCLAYLDGVHLKRAVPLCDVDAIASNVMSAAKQLLQYID